MCGNPGIQNKAGIKRIIFLLKWIWTKIKPFIPGMALLAFLNTLGTASTVGTALASKNLVDLAVAGQYQAALRQGLLLAFLILAMLALNAASSVISARVAETMHNNISLDIYKNIACSDWTAFAVYHSEDILTRMTSDVDIAVNGIAGTIPGLFALSVQLVAAFIALFSMDRMLGILAFALGPMTLLFYMFFRKKLGCMHLKIQELEGKYRAFAQESIINMIIVKAFLMEKTSIKKLRGIREEQLETLLRRNFAGVLAGSTFSAGYWAGYFLAFCWGTMRLSQGLATFGSLTAFLQLIGQIQAPFIGLARSIPQLIATEASAERIIELENLRSENFKGESPRWNRAGICFENVTFYYNNPDCPIIKNANLEIKAGEIVGIAGPSGEGKTTVIRLLLALVGPAQGHLYIVRGDTGGVDGMTNRDGIAAEKLEITASCRNIISYVPQGNTLFSGTIAENLAAANPTATEGEMIDALKQAGAWQFISEMPDGLRTRIGENALGLSEGQTQRISIARAFLKKSAIILLDEATSALDPDAEAHVLRSIRNMQPERTCIIISHRPSTLAICDRIMRMEDGKIEVCPRAVTG